MSTATNKKYREENGVIYFSVTSDGTTGEQWIERLAKNGIEIDCPKNLLSADFKVTNNVTTEIAVLKAELFVYENRCIQNIRTEADKRKLTKPNAEVSCLIREMFSSFDLMHHLKLRRILVMHEAIKDSDDNPRLIDIAENGGNHGNDKPWLRIYHHEPNRVFGNHYGFAFAVSETQN